MLQYDSKQPWSVNISELHGLHADQLSKHQERRDHIASLPPHPDQAQRVAVMDAEAEPLKRHADASGRGKIFYDPSELSGCTQDRQEWVAEARRRGQIERPSDTEPSVHDTDRHEPIRVQRGDPRSSALMTR